MNTDNLSALAVGIGVVALIVGFAIYFNNPSLNKGSSAQASPLANGTLLPAGSNSAVMKVDESQFTKAPELAGITGYINTGSNLTLAGLKGKVVLVDFWTYSCINCIRTLPYLNAWYDKYQKDGLVIIGVHSPEFDFEKNYDNVKAAVDRFGIKYPVVLDSNHDTWNAFHNNYWPRHYLIDAGGYIRSDHIGEGGYAETEQQIQSLLAERAATSGSNTQIDKSISNPNAVSVDFSQITTPEIYLGFGFAREPLGNPQGFSPNQVQAYSISDVNSVTPNSVYLAGEWKNNQDNMELASGTGQIVLKYSAKSVNIVAGGKGELYVSQDGNPLDSHSLGTDVQPSDGSVKIDGERLYNVVSNDNYGTHTVVLNVQTPGFQIYTFTFG